MSEKILLSVALVTRNRPASLERAIRSWRRQPDQPYEIVISDDSSEEHAASVMRLAQEYGCRYVVGPRRGLYANRNAVTQHCTGTHILSADDDHEHPQGFLNCVMTAIRSEPGTVWVIGEFHSWTDHDAGHPLHRPGQLSAHGVLCPIPDGEDVACWSISDGATVYPREIFDSGLRFYEGVKFGASYAEFGCVLHRLHWRIRPLLTTAVIHHYLESPRSFLDPVNENAASLFAALMFSFYYQPSWKNRAVALSKVPLQFLRRPGHASEIVKKAIADTAARRREIARFHGRRGSS